MFRPKEDDKDGEGKRVEDVHDAHHGGVHLAPGEARDGPVGDAYRERDEGGDQPDGQGYPPAVEGPGEEVPPEGVGPQPVLGRRGRGAKLEVLVLVRLREDGSGGAQEGEDCEEDTARKRQAVALQPVPGVAPERMSAVLVDGRHSNFSFGLSQTSAMSARRFIVIRNPA